MERRVDGTEREAKWVSCARIQDNVGYEMLVEDKEWGGGGEKRVWVLVKGEEGKGVLNRL